jgi:hypothetical protein
MVDEIERLKAARQVVERLFRAIGTTDLQAAELVGFKCELVVAGCESPIDPST